MNQTSIPQNLSLQVQNNLNLFGFEFTTNQCIIFAASIVLSFVLKRYISGGVCKVEKDLTGKLAVITGGNTGIGRQTTLQLVKRNCNVIIGARDKGRLEQLMKDISKINPNIKATYSILDLGDKQSIKQFAQFIKSNHNSIDYLINNAGVMMIPQRRQTKDNLQMQIGINHFGHFYLTYLLFPLLKESKEFRIINLSSKAHTRTEGINFEDIHSKKSYSPLVVYAKSKLANVYFSRFLQKKIDDAKLNGICISLHPGVVRTQLTRYMKWYVHITFYLFYPIWHYFTKSANQGAQTTLYTVLENKLKLVPGEYYADCKVGWSTKASKDIDQAQKLWKISEQTWGVKFEI